MSSIDLLVRYLAERARLVVFAPLALLLAVTGRVFGHEFGSFAGFVDSAAQAFVFVLAFRVWDDLEDRERDAREHPRRVMVTSQRTVPFAALLFVLGVAAVVPILLEPEPATRFAVLSLVTGVLLAWYRLRGHHAGFIGAQIVLLKYPAIAFIVAPKPPSAIALTSLYVAVSAYEVFDDPALRASFASLFGKRLS